MYWYWKNGGEPWLNINRYNLFPIHVYIWMEDYLGFWLFMLHLVEIWVGMSTIKKILHLNWYHHNHFIHPRGISESVYMVFSLKYAKTRFLRQTTYNQLPNRTVSDFSKHVGQKSLDIPSLKEESMILPLLRIGIWIHLNNKRPTLDTSEPAVSKK